MLPTPVLPGSHHLQEVYTLCSLPHPFFLRSPFQLPLRFPVPENRKTYPRPECASYPGVPAGRILHDAVSTDPLSGNILSQPVQNTDLVQYDLWKGQNGLCLLSSDLSDLRSFLQNTDM